MHFSSRSSAFKHRQIIAPLVAFLFFSSCALSSPDRPFHVRDAIGMYEFDKGGFAGHSFGRSGNTSGSRPFDFSPDGRQFIVLTKRGLVASNEIEAALWAYDTEAVRRWAAAPKQIATPAPRLVVRLAAVSNDPVISSVRWTADGKGLVFLGRNKTRVGHVYQLAVETGALRQLTPDDQDVVSFAVGAAATVYIVKPAYKPEPMPVTRVLTGRLLPSLVDPERWWGFSQPNRSEMGLIRDGQASLLIDPATREPVRVNYDERWPDRVWISKDGHRAIVPRIVKEVPASWEAYQPHIATARLKATSSIDAEPTIGGSAEELVLVNLETGENAPLLHAPMGASLGYRSRQPAVTWLSDGRTLLLSQAFLPLAGLSEVEAARRAAAPAILLYDVQSRRLSEVASDKTARFEEEGSEGTQERKSLQAVISNSSVDEIAIHYRVRGGIHASASEKIYRAEIYRRGSKGWTFVGEKPVPQEATEATRREPLMLSVEQDLNAPPTLSVARSRAPPGALWDPNPQLSEVALGEASFYQWKGKSDDVLDGVLYKPPGFVPGRHYPLVIQAHLASYDRKHPKFMTTGVFPTAYVGRAMAARGALVLEMSGPRPSFAAGEEDAPRQMAAYRALIDQLSAEGSVDRSRVGYIGFSYSGYYAFHALTKEPDLFAAALVADGNTYGIFEYLASVESAEFLNQFTSVLGGKPFGRDLGNWQKNSPLFSFDNVSAPLRIETCCVLFGMWGEYAALRILDKPVDMIHLWDAVHERVKPQERLESQGGAVDWFDFWLNGHEDSDATKAGQYIRWRELRKLQCQNPRSLRDYCSAAH